MKNPCYCFPCDRLLSGEDACNAQSPSERPVIAIGRTRLTSPLRGETFSITIGFLNLGQITSTNLMIEFIPVT